MASGRKSSESCITVCRRRFLFAGVLALAAGAAFAQPKTDHERLTLDIYRELVEINTVHPNGDNTAAARAMAKRLRDAGFDAKDVEVFEPAPRKGNLIARYRGTGEMRPLLLLAHIDVVDAKKEDWSAHLEPFRLTEEDGYYYGRGTIDDKAMAAIFVANLIRARKEGFRPKRDIIVALTADEEGGTHNGVSLLLKDRRDLIDAEFSVNEGGGGVWRNGKPFAQAVQVSEKFYQSYEFEVASPGGHSSVPMNENAIYDLAGALSRLATLEFPAKVPLVTRLYFAKIASTEAGSLGEALAAIARNQQTEAQLREVSGVPRYNAQLRTTCVATRLAAGHADNALPQRAKATVNCRLLPGEKEAFVASELQRVAGERVKVSPTNAVTMSDPSNPESPVMKTIQRVSDEMWPGVPVMPIMSVGATDGMRLRNAGIPVYGVSGLFLEDGEIRYHGRDERLAVRSFFDGAEFLYRLVKALAS
jgi:acetylornithine deacetylase/succinyl-diaminopimelate desuccinylase-like protein